MKPGDLVKAGGVMCRVVLVARCEDFPDYCVVELDGRLAMVAADKLEVIDEPAGDVDSGSAAAEAAGRGGDSPSEGGGNLD